MHRQEIDIDALLLQSYFLTLHLLLKALQCDIIFTILEIMDSIQCSSCKHRKQPDEFATYMRNRIQHRRLTCKECLVCTMFFN